MTLPSPVESGLAATKIAEEGGPAAVGALVTFMEANALHAESMDGLIRKGIERERDEWKERALYAEERLARIQNRIWDLIA